MRLDAAAPDFEQRFASLLAMKREASQDVDATVRGIIEDVVARGDAALVDYSKRFDRIDLEETGIAVSREDCTVCGLPPTWKRRSTTSRAGAPLSPAIIAIWLTALPTAPPAAKRGMAGKKPELSEAKKASPNLRTLAARKEPAVC